MQSYELASGQKVNLDKSQLLFSRNVPSPRSNELVQLLNVKATESFDKYLGLRAIIGKSKSQVFAFVKERVWKKLKGWKERFLSRAGREVLIKSIVQAIPSHVMSCFGIPLSICHDIDSMISRFFWGGNVDERPMHWVSWEKMTCSKTKGGLGFHQHFRPRKSG